jgi:hypothetical protein
MHYTDIENIVVDKGDEDYEETIVNWRVRRRKVQLRCPKCDLFFDLPKAITIDENGYASGSFYHFCSEQVIDGVPDENDEGWTVMPHLVGYNER